MHDEMSRHSNDIDPLIRDLFVPFDFVCRELPDVAFVIARYSNCLLIQFSCELGFSDLDHGSRLLKEKRYCAR